MPPPSKSLVDDAAVDDEGLYSLQGGREGRTSEARAAEVQEVSVRCRVQVGRTARARAKIPRVGTRGGDGGRTEGGPGRTRHARSRQGWPTLGVWGACLRGSHSD